MANNESLYYAAADRLVSSGLRDAGYDTIAVTCNGWRRNAQTGNLEVDPVTWPRGYKAFIDYLHDRKLKICAYSDTGATNCCGEPVRIIVSFSAVFFNNEENVECTAGLCILNSNSAQSS